MYVALRVYGNKWMNDTPFSYLRIFPFLSFLKYQSISVIVASTFMSTVQTGTANGQFEILLMMPIIQIVNKSWACLYESMATVYFLFAPCKPPNPNNLNCR